MNWSDVNADHRDTARLDEVEEAARVLDEADGVFRTAILRARDSGFRNSEIAERARRTPQRIGQIMQEVGNGPERAFWDPDDGMAVVAVGEKIEAPKEASGPLGPVVSTEARQAYDILAHVLAGQGLDSEYESISAATGGYIDLNRRGLVVVCGPRLSPWVGQVLASDPALGFGHDKQGWYLEDRKPKEPVIWRSPMDNGQRSDYGYLGRLPRPDKRGHFLYLGGIHSPGLAGAALYLKEHLAELWAQARTNRFSLVVRCDFDKTRNITSAELVAGPYVHER